MCFILVGELRILLFMYKLPCHMIDMNRNHLYVPQISLNLHVHFLSCRIVLQSDRPVTRLAVPNTTTLDT